MQPGLSSDRLDIHSYGHHDRSPSTAKALEEHGSAEYPAQLTCLPSTHNRNRHRPLDNDARSGPAQRHPLMALLTTLYFFDPSPRFAEAFEIHRSMGACCCWNCSTQDDIPARTDIHPADAASLPTPESTQSEQPRSDRHPVRDAQRSTPFDRKKTFPISPESTKKS